MNKRPELRRTISEEAQSDDDLTWPSAFTLIDGQFSIFQKDYDDYLVRKITVIDTYVDARIDLIERRIHETSDKLRERASNAKEKAAEIIRSRGSRRSVDKDAENDIDDDDESKFPHSPALAATKAKDFYERESAKYKLLVRYIYYHDNVTYLAYFYQLSNRVQNLASKWKDAKVVQLRDKLSFCFGLVIFSFIIYFN